LYLGEFFLHGEILSGESARLNHGSVTTAINVDLAIARPLARFPNGYAVYPTRCHARRVVEALVAKRLFSQIGA
jgi:hypothetical protein